MADISKGTENDRRKKIIGISRANHSKSLQKLLRQLSLETSIQNKRHIIRSLGNIKDKSVAPILEKMLSSQDGEILGDIVRALAEIGATSSAESIALLKSHDLAWVSESAIYALRKLGR